jgi:hypothetical protein
MVANIFRRAGIPLEGFLLFSSVASARFYDIALKRKWKNSKILSHVGVTINGFWIGFIALLHSTRNK